MVPTYAEDGTHDWKVHKKLHQVAPTALSVCEERIKEHVAWQREQFSRRSFGLRCAVAVRTLILEGTNSWRRDGERHVPSSTLTSGQGRGQTPYDGRKLGPLLDAIELEATGEDIALVTSHWHAR